jgi:GH15 family glucan-1,4-alpha-glucosidase
LQAGDVAGAERAVSWMEGTADDEGNLPEQVPSHLRHPEETLRWERRWGPSASPLLWSHAAYVTARLAMEDPPPRARDARTTRLG